jgi:hypothetical protein
MVGLLSCTPGLKGSLEGGGKGGVKQSFRVRYDVGIICCKEGEKGFWGKWKFPEDSAVL